MTQLNDPVIVVVGSLHYDIMVEAPDRPRKGETVAGYAWRPKFGGKGGNQAVAAAKAAARVRMVGAVGNDEFGRFLLDRLEASGIDHSRVARLQDVGSGMSVAISDSGGDYGAVIVSGSNLRIEVADLSDPGLWTDAQVLILQNEVPDAVNIAAARAAKSAGARVCLNAAPARALPPELTKLVDIMIVNAVEAEDLCGVPVRDLASATDAAMQLTTRYGSVIVTAGGDGVAGCESGRSPIQVQARPVALVSTHGAGDMFVGSFAAALARGQDLQRSIELANDAAAVHVSTPQVD